ncbi:DUF2986 domain-containing protein [Photobacterium kagoshimensis]|uniref:DUF2986 domain-containing protein n=1 Tax=Photobacterium kagoshimensis TaxID=2910242 RepID=UPI003D0E3AF9
MNRKKKVNQILKKRMKQANSKLHKSNKPRYISKADRAKMEQEEALAAQNEAQTDAVVTEEVDSESKADAE